MLAHACLQLIAVRRRPRELRRARRATSGRSVHEALGAYAIALAAIHWLGRFALVLGLTRACNLFRMFKASAFESARGDLVSHPIEPSWIREGNPVARAITLAESPDGQLTTGLWDCTAGVFTWIYPLDEVVHILEGEVRVDDGSRTHHLVPGSNCYFPTGLETVWTVEKYVKKMFVMRAPKRSRLRRLASAVKGRLIKR